uniref:Uncharacterized protein n=1 Tax=Lotharella vacuolata TaxID=74820 RepID=A0A0H5BQV2_9EUKA|nr:hypothetical protein [Lotharella vacuolata]
MKNGNNLKRKIKFNICKKKNHSKKKKFNHYNNNIFNNYIKNIMLNTAVSYKKSNKFSDNIKKAKGFSDFEFKVSCNKKKLATLSSLNYDRRRKKNTFSALKINVKKLSIMFYINNLINNFRN